MMSMTDALQLIEDRRGDNVVLPTMTGGTTWNAISENRPMDLPVSGAMGKASSLALGIAMARPDKKVIIIDGDGSLLMNLGSLVTVGGRSPENLYHFVIDNGVYGVTGGQPVPNRDGFSFAGIAKDSGYASSYEFDDLEDFATTIDEILGGKGPVLVSLKTIPEVENTPIQLRPEGNRRRTPRALPELKEALNK